MIVVKKQVKEFVKKLEASISADAYDILEEKVGNLLVDAVNRAKANGRKTLKAKDL